MLHRPPTLKPCQLLIAAFLLLIVPVSLRGDDTPIHSVTVNEPAIAVPNNRGDIWTPAWTAAGDLFSPSDDSKGFNNAGSGNVVINHITGDQPDKLAGDTVNLMIDYGHENQEGHDGYTWKSSGCMALDGALYVVIARHKYGEKSGDADMRQTARNSSIIKSTDGGQTWTRSARENYDQPMFPGSRFATAYFINYGQDGQPTIADQSNKYVYALSNNGFWDNGDNMVLGRVLKSKFGDLNAADWQFFTGDDGLFDANWSSNLSDARYVLSDSGNLGMTGAVYLPTQKCYFMIGWHYPAGGGKKPDASKTTEWTFYTAAHPWGPWQDIGSHTFTPQGFYCPAVCPKFTSADGNTLWVFTAGNWNNPDFYKLTAVSLTLK